MRIAVIGTTGVLALVLAACDSPYKRLTVVDTCIRADKARRDFAFETEYGAQLATEEIGDRVNIMPQTLNSQHVDVAEGWCEGGRGLGGTRVTHAE